MAGLFEILYIFLGPYFIGAYLLYSPYLKKDKEELKVEHEKKLPADVIANKDLESIKRKRTLAKGRYKRHIIQS